MATSEVQISNIALSNVGISKTISSLSEASVEARMCNLHYTTCRDNLLYEYNWPFARRFGSLQLIEEADAQVWADTWDYVYGLPIDTIRVRSLLTGERRTRVDPQAWEVGFDGSDTVLFTDAEDAVAEYTARVTDPNRFDLSFANCLSWYLAVAISKPLNRKDSERAELVQLANAHFLIATKHAGNYGQPDPMPDSEFIRARS